MQNDDVTHEVPYRNCVSATGSSAESRIHDVPMNESASATWLRVSDSSPTATQLFRVGHDSPSRTWNGCADGLACFAHLLPFQPKIAVSSLDDGSLLSAPAATHPAGILPAAAWHLTASRRSRADPGSGTGCLVHADPFQAKLRLRS